MRTGGHRREVRGSALWGSGKRGTGSRGNALWGSGKRRTALLTTLAVMLAVPLDAGAAPNAAASAEVQAFVAPSLLSGARTNPGQTFAVIVQGKGGNQAAKAVADVTGLPKKVNDLRSIEGVAVELTGAQIVALAAD